MCKCYISISNLSVNIFPIYLDQVEDEIGWIEMDEVYINVQLLKLLICI